MPRRAAVLVLCAGLASSACGGSTTGLHAPPTVTPAADGWVHVAEAGWFTLDFPATPAISTPRWKLPWLAEAEARQYEASTARQAFLALFVHSKGGWDTDPAKLVDASIAALAGSNPIRSLHRAEDQRGADVTFDETAQGQPMRARALVVFTARTSLMLVVYSPRDATEADLAAEHRFLHSVGDSPD